MLEPRNPSWQTGATRYRFSRRSMASTIRHWKRWSKIGIVSRIKIIRELGKRSGAKKQTTTWATSKQRPSRRTWISECQDYHISVWSSRRVPGFENWFKELRTIQIDTFPQQNPCQNQPFNLFSPESKQMIQNVGNIEICKLLETEPNTHCKACLSYWDTGIVYCTCGHLLHKKNRGQSEIRQIFDGLFSPWVCHQEKNTSWISIRGKSRIWLTNWKSFARKEIFKKSMTDSYKIKKSVFEWLKIIEMKMFFDDGMFLRMKITLTIWKYKNTSTMKTNGGFIQISKVLTPCHWEIVLISSKRCPLCNDYNKKQKKRTTRVHLFYKPKH